MTGNPSGALVAVEVGLGQVGADRRLCDPNNLMPDIEKTFRDAAQLVLKEGGFLGDDIQSELAAKLSGRWSSEVKRAVREILTDDESPDSQSRIEKMKAIANEFGLTVAPTPVPLPLLQKDETDNVDGRFG
jgi:hypothetical protein